ncbi:MAG TPA: hypothetical protein VHP35_04360, partial [Terriglobia bacterium]|nr:hypothetical protein [Terriglobia bacterium]
DFQHDQPFSGDPVCIESALLGSPIAMRSKQGALTWQRLSRNLEAINDRCLSGGALTDSPARPRIELRPIGMLWPPVQLS